MGIPIVVERVTPLNYSIRLPYQQKQPNYPTGLKIQIGLSNKFLDNPIYYE